MATETTKLLSGCVINIPKDVDSGILDKTKGLSLEELMPFKDDPWWINVRKTFFLSFWITLIVIFIAACILSIMQHGSCSSINKVSSGSGSIIKHTTASLIANSTRSTLGTVNHDIVSMALQMLKH